MNVSSIGHTHTHTTYALGSNVGGFRADRKAPRAVRGPTRTLLSLRGRENKHLRPSVDVKRPFSPINPVFTNAVDMKCDSTKFPARTNPLCSSHSSPLAESCFSFSIAEYEVFTCFVNFTNLECREKEQFAVRRSACCVHCFVDMIERTTRANSIAARAYPRTCVSIVFFVSWIKKKKM